MKMFFVQNISHGRPQIGHGVVSREFEIADSKGVQFKEGSVKIVRGPRETKPISLFSSKNTALFENRGDAVKCYDKAVVRYIQRYQKFLDKSYQDLISFRLLEYGLSQKEKSKKQRESG